VETRKPRLLILITLSELGGAQAAVSLLLPGLVDRFEVTLAAHGRGPLRDSAEAASVPYVELKHVRRAINPWQDALGLLAALLLQLLACLTMWNAFYSLLWGFSGSLMHDLFTDATLRDRERLIKSYEGDGEMDRILARRVPNLVRGGWVATDGQSLTLPVG